MHSLVEWKTLTGNMRQLSGGWPCKGAAHIVFLDKASWRFLMMMLMVIRMMTRYCCCYYCYCFSVIHVVIGVITITSVSTAAKTSGLACAVGISTRGNRTGCWHGALNRGTVWQAHDL